MTVEVIGMDAEAPIRAQERALELFMEFLTDGALDTMREVAPEDDGELIRGLHLRRDGRFDEVIVGEADHTERVLRGTGLYGPRRQRIKPKKAKALVFPWDKIGGRTAIFKGDIGPAGGRSAKQNRYLFARWAESRGMVPFFVWPAGMPPRNFAEDTLNREVPRIDAYLSEAAAITRGEFGLG